MVEANADDLLHVIERDLLAALQGNQCARSPVDDHVPPDAVHTQQAADLADLQLDLVAAVHLRQRGGGGGGEQQGQVTVRCSRRARQSGAVCRVHDFVLSRRRCRLVHRSQLPKLFATCPTLTCLPCTEAHCSAVFRSSAMVSRESVRIVPPYWGIPGRSHSRETLKA